MTHVVAFNASPRKNGNTSILIGHILEELETNGITTETVHIGGRIARGCTACMQCYEEQNGHCSLDDDIVNSCIDRMIAADGIVLGSPVYFLDVTAEMKALIDRAGLVAMANHDLFQRKVGVAVTVMRRAGATTALATMLNFMLFSGMTVPGKPVIGIGNRIGSVRQDEEGMGRARYAGKTMAWLLKALETARGSDAPGV